MKSRSTDLLGKETEFPIKVSTNHPKMEENIINVYPEMTKQRMYGFGGALTQATGEILNSLPLETAEEILHAYYAPEAAAYAWVRVSIDSCDFSSFMYTAAETKQDAIQGNLSFSVDEQYIFPWLEKISQIVGHPVSVLMSPWSPPSFMKTNGRRKQGGKLETEWYSVWAQYISLYVQEYRRRGFDVKFVTIQNEPNATQLWESCLYSAQEERTFCEEYLHPAFVSHGLEEVGILFWDHNKERMVQRVKEFWTPAVHELVAGIAVHGYCGDHFDALRICTEQMKGKRCILSEFCLSIKDDGKQLTQLKKYAHEYIGDIKGGADTLFDWNLLLDEKGGPNHVQNYCLAPIHSKSGKIEKNTVYTVLHHLSRAFPLGSICIEVTTYDSTLDVGASLHPEGTIFLVIANYGKKRRVHFRIGEKVFSATVPTKSMNTVVLKEENYE